MLFTAFSFCVLICLFFTSCAEEKGKLQVPGPELKPVILEKHGHERKDDFYWLRERDNPKVIAYLEAENRYFESAMAHTKGFQTTLFNEIKGRIKPADQSVPYKEDGYYYYSRYEEGKEYPLYCRKKGELSAHEEIMLDVNQLAEGYNYFSVRVRNVSPKGNILAYAKDTTGRRFYTLCFKNLEAGTILKDEISNVTGNLAWANDNKTVFYGKQDPQTLRSHRIYRHILGTDTETDELVYEEKDDTFRTYVGKTKSKKYIMISSRQTMTTEVRYLDADIPQREFTVFLKRKRGHEYTVDHYKDSFLITTNLDAENFRLMKTPLSDRSIEKWQEMIPHRKDVFLENLEVFKDYLVLKERKDGLVRIRIIPWNGSEEHYLGFHDPAYSAWIGQNPEFDTPVLRYVYTSMVTPRSTYDYTMQTRDQKLLKQDEVLGGFESANYRTERLHAKARDGVMVPISIVYRKEMKRDGTNPLLLYGYGSYGASMDAGFKGDILSLLDRGFIYAIAHVRGGQELGKQWYEDGKLLKKKNTFYDFIDCAEYLIKEKFTGKGKLYARGGSAGGLLMGAVVNIRPDLFTGVAAGVPFVDVITTMLDETIPLTTSEYDEWGDPNIKKYYDYILSYSPYDNVEAKEYPNILVTTGLHDSQVQYWEPAKWVAKLRCLKTGDGMVLLKTNMEAGHSGASGRFRRYKDTALVYAFFLNLSGRIESSN